MDAEKLYSYVAAMYRVLKQDQRSRTRIDTDHHSFVMDVEIKSQRVLTTYQGALAQRLILANAAHIVPSDIRAALAESWKDLGPYGDYRRMYGRKRAVLEIEESDTPKDLWGEHWTPADVNSAGFGFDVPADATILGVTVELETQQTQRMDDEAA